MYKLKVYNEKCKVDHEEFFTTLEEMDNRYIEITEGRYIAPTAWACRYIAPTAWVCINDEWCRMFGY